MNYMILDLKTDKLDEGKDTNPKDAVGTKKAPLSTISGPVMFELGLSMLEGARKYGRHNYRIAGIRASVYYDAAQRHLNAWWEGEDIDPDSGLSHVVKAMACLMVLRDAEIHEMVTDDRPPPTKEEWLKKYNELASEIIERIPEPKDAYTQADVLSHDSKT